MKACINFVRNYPESLMSTQTIFKRGSSLAIRLPAVFAKQMHLEDGAKVELVLEGKVLVVQRAEPLPNPRAFFAGVKASCASLGLFAVGCAHGMEIR
jgi:antitoxin component of MazEF toxin-antitoxin module